MAFVLIDAGFVFESAESRANLIQTLSGNPAIVHLTVAGGTVSIRPTALQAIAETKDQITPWIGNGATA